MDENRTPRRGTAPRRRRGGAEGCSGGKMNALRLEGFFWYSHEHNGVLAAFPLRYQGCLGRLSQSEEGRAGIKPVCHLHSNGGVSMPQRGQRTSAAPDCV